METMRFLLILALFGLGACAAGKTAGDGISDSRIKFQVQRALQAQQGANYRNLDVDVYNRAVTVSGLVNTREDKRALESLLRKIPGVEQVVVNVLFEP
ncbi:MAG: BON domain-containing protein [Elusimicrobia bacterium]|nr:BON domain-containing protein [Elusimicrobiota bacterium]